MMGHPHHHPDHWAGLCRESYGASRWRHLARVAGVMAVYSLAWAGIIAAVCLVW